jgi:hypothetical protein
MERRRTESKEEVLVVTGEKNGRTGNLLIPILALSHSHVSNGIFHLKSYRQVHEYLTHKKSLPYFFLLFWTDLTPTLLLVYMD